MAWEEACRRLEALVVPVTESESVPVAAARARILAAPVVAGRDHPPWPSSAVDGYACRREDLHPEHPVRLPVIGRVAAGHALDRPLGPGEAVRIFTGAPLPAGADAVVMQEHCRRDSGTDTGPGPGIGPGTGPDTVLLPAGKDAGSHHWRPAGEDTVRGRMLLAQGRRLRPTDLGVAAGQGLAELPVVRRLRVAVFSNGDELNEPGRAAPSAAGIYDSNRFTLIALLNSLGFITPTDLGILPDRPAEMRAALERLIAAGDHDAVMTSGGVSVGEEDHVKAVVAGVGEMAFWRLAIKPGKPIGFGRVGMMPFLGLPGNPVALVVGFLLIARALLLRLGGGMAAPPLRVQVCAGFDWPGGGARQEFVPVRLSAGPGGEAVAERLPGNSGTPTTLIAADGFAALPVQGPAFAAGAVIPFIPLNEVWS